MAVSESAAERLPVRTDEAALAERRLPPFLWLRNRGWRHLVAILGVLFVVVPIIYIIASSFNKVDTLTTARMIPEGLTTDSYKEIFASETFPFPTWLWNSFKIAFIASSLQLIMSTAAAYAFARMRWRGRRVGLLTILLVQMFPQFLAFVALFLFLQQLGDFLGEGVAVRLGVAGLVAGLLVAGVAALAFRSREGRGKLYVALTGLAGLALAVWSLVSPDTQATVLPGIDLDTHAGLILVYLGGSIGVNTWLIKGFMDSIPMSLDESAKVDGASDWQIFSQIITPLARPVLAVIFVITFVFVYNEFILASFVLSDVNNLTVAVGLDLFVESEYSAKWGQLSAMAVIGALPIVAVYLAAQDHLVAGLTQGAVKE